MVRERLSLALGLLVVGCSTGATVIDGPDGIGNEDTPFFPDTGTCAAADPIAIDHLDCVANDDGTGTVTAHFTVTAPGACCADWLPTATPTYAGSDVTIALDVSACNCCASCACSAPPTQLEIPIATLPLGEHVVHLGAASCTLTVREPAACTALIPNEVRMPHFMHEGATFGATLIANASLLCGCTPSIPPWTPGNTLRLDLCSCATTTTCTPTGYEANVFGPILPVGDTVVTLPDGSTRTVTVVDRDAPLHDVEVTGLRLLGYDGTRVRSGSPVAWAVVSGTDALCCGTPIPVLDAADGVGVDVHSAAVDTCDCATPTPRPFEEWVPMYLGAGTYTIRAGNIFQMLTIAP